VNDGNDSTRSVPYGRLRAIDAVDLGGFRGEWSIVPRSDADRVLLYFHGGGYCSGSILSHRRMVTEAGRAAGVRTLAVGYRLSPEKFGPT
jgi:acetyl esterase/lipase